jgi:dienelactone hydrolase
VTSLLSVILQRKTRLLPVFLFLCINGFGQLAGQQDWEFEHIRLNYKQDSIDVLMVSKKGQELDAKPLLFFCQGSLPVPLIITEGGTTYPPFPFDTRKLCERYHLVIVGKPGIPLRAESTRLQADFSYLEDSTSLPPLHYSKNNYLEYYVDRNLFVIDYLLNQRYVDRTTVIAAGHSQGARVAFEMALKSKDITHLIYASGNPCGQIMSMVSRSRQRESPFDSTVSAENDFRLYEAMIADSSDDSMYNDDSFKSIYSFSKSSLNTFQNLDIPVLVCYGTFDSAAPFNDLLRAEMIRMKKKNITFKAYIGLDHNYFGRKETGETDYGNFNWDKVADDWLNWIHSR